ncbi:MAG: hypothetical protein GY708_24800 [Actinomycetia bacterium]|nr:hypothetical protein [Actinomycetes bacterium]MCP4959602.1 hypothetical protein [Actinomycetes bacterium]
MLAISFTEGIEDAWSDIASFVPKLIAALVILLVGWFIAKMIHKVVHRVLTKINFDNLVDRSGLGTYVERAGYPDSALLLAKIIYFAVMIIVLQLAIGAFGDNAVQDVLNDLLAFIPKLFVALIIVVLTGAVANAVRGLVSGAVSHLSYGGFITQAVTVAIWIIGGFAALDQIEIAEDIVDTLFTTVTASLGAILVIKFGVGGIWAARDRFWPVVYDKIGSNEDD